MLEMLWTSNGLHLIFIYIPIKVQMFFTFQKPYVMFPFNLLFLLPQLFLLWRCHLWYFLPVLPQLFILWKCHLWCLFSLLNYLYHSQHYPSSFTLPLLLCFLVPYSLLNLRLHFPQLYSSSQEHFLEIILKPFFYCLLLFTSLP